MGLGTRENLDKRSLSNKLGLHGVPGNHCLFAEFSGHSSTTEHKYISSSRLYTIGVSDPVTFTVSFYYIRVSNVSQTIANCASRYLHTLSNAVQCSLLGLLLHIINLPIA